MGKVALVKASLVLLTSITAAPAQSAIIVLADNRFLSINPGETYTPSGDRFYVDFDQRPSGVRVLQNSLAWPVSMLGLGYISASVPYAETTTEFAVTFGVSEPTDFEFSGSLYQGGDDGDSGDLFMSLRENGQEISGLSYSDLTFGANGFDVRVHFLVGNTYELVLSAHAPSFSSYRYDALAWEFYLGPHQPVPVPAAAWLFGSGLIGLLGIARRKNA